MFRLLRYIVFFLIGYKLLKTLFNASNANNKSAAAEPAANSNLHSSPGQQHNNNNKFEDAELIDYEEVK